MGETTLPDPEPFDGDRKKRRLPQMRDGRYVDFQWVAKGGMGVVYLAKDTDLGRRVAMKVVRPPTDPTEPLPHSPTRLVTPDTDGPVSDTFDELKARFLREASVTGSMEHPGIVPVYELGETEAGVPYYTMRFVRGNRTLRAALVGRPSFSRRVVLLEPWLKVCDTLAYAHNRGVIHRDLKPANIALGEYGEVIVLDWGLAKVKDRPDDAGEALRAEMEQSDPHNTVPGAIGTPGFMSPEAARGELDKIDHRSDVYSLGVMLFEILTGRLPQDVSNLGVYMTSLLHGDAPRADEIDGDVPQALADICAHALATDVETRVQTAEELAARVRFWEYSTQLEREVAQRFAEAEAGLEAAEGVAGAAALGPLDRAVTALARAREVMPEDPRVAQLETRIEALRRRTQSERDHEARRKLVRRVALGSLVALVLAAAVVVWLVEGQRREAVSQRNRADASALAATEANQANERSLARAYAVAARQFLQERRGAAAGLAAARSLQLDESVDAWIALTQALHILPPRSESLSVGMAVHSIAFDQTGDRLAAGGEYGLVRVWDTRTGRTLHEMSARGGALQSIQFVEEGQRLLTGGGDGTLRVFDIQEGRVIRSLVGPADPITDVALRPNAAGYAAVTSGGRLLLWDLPAGALAAAPNLLLGGLSSVAIDAQGTLWVLSEGGALVMVTDPGAEKPVTEVVRDAGVAHMALVAEGRALVLATKDGDLIRLDTASRESTHTWPRSSHAPDAEGIRTLAAAGTGVCAVYDDGSAIVLHDPNRPPLVLGGAGTSTRRAALAPGGRLMATADADRRIRLWTAERAAPVAVLDGHSMTITGIAVRGRSTGIVTAAQDGTVMSWEGTPLEPGAPIRVEQPGWGVRCLSVSDDGRTAFCISVAADEKSTTRLSAIDLARRRIAWQREVGATIITNGLLACSPTEVLTLRASGRIGAFDVKDGSFLREIGLGPEGGRGSTNAIARAASGKRMVRAVYLADDQAYALRVIDLESGEETELPERTVDMAMSVAVSRDGHWAAMGTAAGRAGLWNLEAGTFVRWMDVPGRGVFSLAFTNDGRQLFTGATEICVFDVAEPGLRQRWDGHAGNVSALAFDANGTRLHSASFDGSVRVWHLDERGPLTRLRAADPCSALVLTQDGRRAFVGTTAGTVEEWDAVKAARTQTIPRTGDDPVMATAAAIERLAVSADGSRLAVAEARQTVAAYDVSVAGRAGATGPPRRIDRPVTGIGLSPDGGQLIVASSMMVSDRMPPAFIEAERTRAVEVFALDDPDAAPGKIQGHATRPTALTVLADGRVLYGTAGGRMHVHAADDPKAFTAVDAHSRDVTHLFPIAGGERLLSGGAGTTTVLWAVDGWRALARLDGSGPFAGDAAGTWLARAEELTPGTWNSPEYVRLWSPGTDGRGFVLASFERGVGAMAISPDGGRLWMISPIGFWGGDREIRRFDLDWWRQGAEQRRAGIETHTGIRLKGLAPTPVPSSHFTELVPGALER